MPDSPSLTCGLTAGTPRDVTFDVAGAPRGTIADIRLERILITTSFIGDIAVVLIAPDGTTVSIFGQTGKTSVAGPDSTNAAGPYDFTDDPLAGNWWTTAADLVSTDTMPSRDYRASTPGGLGVLPADAGQVLSMSAALAGVTDPNGTWRLRFTDNCATDIATVGAGARLLLGIDPGCADEQAAVAAAQAKLAAAQGKVAAAQAQVSSATGNLTSAQAGLAKAQQKVKAATKALKKANKAKSKAKNKAKSKAKIAKAKKALAAAKSVVPLATSGVTLAQSGVTLANAVVTEVDAHVATAQDAVAGAQAAQTACAAS